MLRDNHAFSSFSVADLKSAYEFYGQTLGLSARETPEGLSLELAGGGRVFIYPKPNHTPASFTVLNFLVDDIAQAVVALGKLGVSFQHYDDPGIKTDDAGIHHSEGAGTGPNIAWFKDPAGNILSLVEEK